MQLPLPYFSFGQQRVELREKQAALIATPEKALCDKIVVTSGLNFRSGAQSLAWLTDDMRMETDALRKLNINMISSWLEAAPKRRSIGLLVKTLEGL